MASDYTRPVRSVGRESDRKGVVVKRSPLDEAFGSRQRIDADRRGVPYLVVRDKTGYHHFVELQGERMHLGRADEADVRIDWDRSVSRQHATFELMSSGWSVVDDGKSLNGTLVNGERIRGRRFLDDRDLVQVGQTALAFREPPAVGVEADGATQQALQPH